MRIEETRNKITLFPTILYQFKLDECLIDELDNLIENEYRDWKDSNPIISISNDDQFQRKEPVFLELIRIIDNEIDAILNNMKVVRDSHYISSMWHNVSSDPYRHLQHIHPNAFLSGIIYVRTPEGCGVTGFSDPRIQKQVFCPDVYEYDYENTPNFMQKPIKGLVTIFPGWLQHYVDFGNMDSASKRITTSFNYNIHGHASLKTAKLKY